jgi:hypothetical protein
LLGFDHFAPDFLGVVGVGNVIVNNRLPVIRAASVTIPLQSEALTMPLDGLRCLAHPLADLPVVQPLGMKFADLVVAASPSGLVGYADPLHGLTRVRRISREGVSPFRAWDSWREPRLALARAEG